MPADAAKENSAKNKVLCQNKTTAGSVLLFDFSAFYLNNKEKVYKRNCSDSVPHSSSIFYLLQHKSYPQYKRIVKQYE